jgi:hypothetical protein
MIDRPGLEVALKCAPGHDRATLNQVTAAPDLRRDVVRTGTLRATVPVGC